MSAALLFPHILAANIDGRVHNIQYRQSQFRRLRSTLFQNLNEITKALLEGSEHSSDEVRAEIFLTFSEIRTHYDSLNVEKSLEEEYRIAHGKDHRKGRRGVGIVYIIPIAHTIFFSSISAMVAALAAGNCIILQLAGTLPIIELLRKILCQALDSDIFAISEVMPDDAFLSQTLLINQEHSKHDRVVAVVDHTADVVQAANKLMSVRFAFGGTSPYAPDLVMVHEAILTRFLEAAVQMSGKSCAVDIKAATNSCVSPRLLSKAERSPDAQVIVSGTGWGIVKVECRESELLQGKLNERVLLVHSFTSLDDAIEASRRDGSPAASYIFASPQSAKYLAHFTDAHLSWVNHIPTEMLMGPMVKGNTSLNPKTRYSTAEFEVLRSQVVKETQLSLKINHLLSKKPTRESSKIWEDAIAPLKPTGQGNGGNVGHFEQGIITGGVVTLTLVVGMTGIVGYFMLNFGLGSMA
ncbi:aldehyde dehydrogenase PutA [Penicillium cataractarum]|uniref:Aldehyde dehydrogenase PutA n=1 Tax=Penicillium cataractarum TaxID=2100454 RepID=A0A9W9SFZ8_9EURO|nr:aldehyde dehydrogenase PutA [Penicillium cataractarum]KAJ5377417.1 aldehyde dehydrogenase PutA [Penicillium cataractarum]